MLKSRLLPVMILALTVSAQAAYADDDAKAEKPEKEKKVCKSERMTGSLTRVNRICMTQAEWDRVRESTNNTINNMVNNGRRLDDSGASGPGGAR